MRGRPVVAGPRSNRLSALASFPWSGVGDAGPSAAANAQALRVKRLREDAQRPLSVNLAEGIALSHKLLGFTGALKK